MPIDLPGPAQPGVKKRKRGGAAGISSRTGAYARNPARTGSHAVEGFGSFQLSPGDSRAGAGTGEGQGAERGRRGRGGAGFDEESWSQRYLPP